MVGDDGLARMWCLQGYKVSQRVLPRENGYLGVRTQSAQCFLLRQWVNGQPGHSYVVVSRGSGLHETADGERWSLEPGIEAIMACVFLLAHIHSVVNCPREKQPSWGRSLWSRNLSLEPGWPVVIVISSLLARLLGCLGTYPCLRCPIQCFILIRQLPVSWTYDRARPRQSTATGGALL